MLATLDDAPSRLQRFCRDWFPDCELLQDPNYIGWRCFGDDHIGWGTRSPDGLSFDSFLGRIPDQLRVDSVAFPAQWLVNLFVAPHQRCKFESLHLFHDAMNWDGISLSTGAGPQMVRLYEALNWVRISSVSTFYMPFRLSRLLRLAENKGRSNDGVQSWLLKSPISDMCCQVRGWIKFGSKSRSDRVRDVEPRDLDRLSKYAQKVAEHRRISTSRSEQRLRNRLFERIAGVTRALLYEVDGEIAGYVVCKFMEVQGASRWLDVVDVCTEDSGIFRMLLVTAYREWRNVGLDFIRIRTSIDCEKKWLQSMGFIQRTMPVSDDVFAYSRDETVRLALHDGPWWFSSWVSDRSEYGRDEVDGSKVFIPGKS